MSWSCSIARCLYLFLSGWLLVSGVSVTRADAPIRVGVYENPPKVFSNEDGRAVGIFPEILEHVANNEGWDLDWRPCVWAHCLEMLEQGSLDIMVDVAWSEDRAERFLFTRQSVMQNWATVYSGDGARVESLLDLEGLRVAVMKDSIHTDGEQGIRSLLQQFDVDVEYVETDGYGEVFELLDGGGADVGIVNRIFGAMQQYRFDVSRSPIVFNPRQLHFAFPLGSDRSYALRDALDRHIRAQKDNRNSVLHQALTFYLSGAVDTRSRIEALDSVRQRIDLTPAERAWLEAHPRIRVGVDPEFAPFEIVTDDGRYLGAAADYVLLVGRILGVSMEPVIGVTWTEATRMAIEGEIDVLPAVGITEERKQYFNYSRPYLAFPRVIVTRGESMVDGIDDLDGLKVAVQENSSHAGFLREQTDIEPVLFPTFHRALLAVSRGEMDALVGNLAVTTHWIREASLTNLKIAGHVSDQTFPLAFAVRRDWPELVTLIDKALGALSPQDHANIKRRWLPVETSRPGLAEALRSRLTPEEWRWLEQHPVIRTGVDPSYAPYSFLSESGQYRGVAVDYLERIGNALGIDFELSADQPWSEILERARDRRLDLVATAVQTAERTRDFEFTQIYIPTPLVIMTRNDRFDIKRPVDLTGRRVALVRDYSSSERVREEHPDVVPVWTDSALEALRAVATGEADAYVGVLGTAVHLAEKHGIANLQVAGGYEMRLNGQRFAVRKDWPVLAGILDKALDAIPAKEHNDILRKWLPVEGKLETDDTLRLTQDERIWLAENPIIRIGTNAGSAPLEFRTQEGEYRGISVDFVNEVSDMLGVRFEFVERDSWAEILGMAERREVDLLIAASPTQNRRRFLTFTDPYLEMPVSIFTGPAIAFVHDIEQLNGQAVAVVDGHAVEELLARNYPDIRLVKTGSAEEAVRLLARGDVDAYLGNTLVTSHLLSHSGLSNVKIAGETPFRHRQSMAVRSDWTLFPSILQKALNAIPASTRDDIYRTWTSVEQKPPFDYLLLAQVVGAGLVVLGFVSFWNRKLAREVRQREEAEQRAHTANQAKSSFLANMSHEIRTPMNAILGYAQLLARDKTLTPTQRESLEIIDRNGAHLIELINDVLEMSKIEAGHASVQLENLDLVELLESLIAVFNYQAARKEIDLRLEIDDDVPRFVKTDSGKLRQVLVNLLGNAIKFTTEGFVRLGVARIRSNEDDLRLSFEVEDTGRGIDPQDLSRIFNAFQQAEHSSMPTEGTGLGLAISQRFAQLLGGSLEVESQPGKGSRFSLRVSLKRGDASQVAEKSPERKVRGLAPGQGIVKALVVDDREENRTLLTRLLQSAGLTVREALDGVEAVAICRTWFPDVVLMDLRMPNMDGFEATEKIRELGGDRRVPIIAVTASVLRDERSRILAAGMDAFIRKPFRESEIFAEIARQAGVRFEYEDEDTAGMDEARDRIPARPDDGTRPGVRILVVDDDEANRELMVSFMEVIGFEAESAADGNEAFVKWQTSKHDMVITDCNMPGRNGVELARDIRAAESGGHGRTSLIALTGDPDRLRQACLEAGINEILGKPVRIEELETLLERYLEPLPAA